MRSDIYNIAGVQYYEAASPVVHEYLVRLDSHLHDGYCLRHATRTDKACIARLKHMSNGNEIILHLDFNRQTLIQYTNKLITFIMVYD